MMEILMRGYFLASGDIFVIIAIIASVAYLSWTRSSEK